MTTFAFANVEASFSGSTTKDHGEQTLYTVPSGKLAKIKFDSYHLSVSSTGNMISDVYSYERRWHEPTFSGRSMGFVLSKL